VLSVYLRGFDGQLLTSNSAHVSPVRARVRQALRRALRPALRTPRTTRFARWPPS